MLAFVTEDYRYNKDKLGATNKYVKISNDIIDKEVSKYIQYEIKLISYNDYIINIKNSLDNFLFYKFFIYYPVLIDNIKVNVFCAP